MRLKQLQVRRMPGIDDPFTVSDIGRSLNVVYGPNEAGKTSLCKAVRAVLWGGADHRCWVEAVWDDAGRVRTSAIESGRLAWQVDGVEGKPDLPPPHLAGCFAVRVDELLPESATDTGIAEEIATRMRGGYSVEKVLGDLASSAPKLAQKAGLIDARGHLRQAEAAQRAAAEHEAELPRLRQQRDVAQQAQDHLNPLTTALDLAKWRTKLLAADLKLEQFPDGMDRIQAGDLTTLESKTQLVADAEGRLTSAEEAIRLATDRIGEAQLPGDHPLDEAELSEWDERTGQAARCEQAAFVEAGNEAAAKTAMGHARDALAPGAADGLPTVDRSTVADAENLLADAMEIEAEDKALHYKLALVQAGAEVKDPDALSDGAKILADWLAVTDAVPLQASRSPRLAGIALGATAILTGALAALLLYQPVFWLAASAGVALLIWYLLASRRPVSGVDPEQARAERRQAYEQTGFDSPKAWDRAGVQAQLHALLRLMRVAAEEAWKATRRSALGADASRIVDGQKQARKAREAFERRTGIALDPNLLQATAFVHALFSYKEARGRWDEAKAKRQAAETEAARLLAAVNEFLARLPFAGTTEVTDSAGATARLKDLRQRSTSLKQALTDKEQATDDRTTAEGLVRQRKADVGGFLQSRGVDSDEELSRRVELLPAWQEATEKKRDAESAIGQAERNLEPYPDYRYLSEAEAEAKLQTARDEAPKLTEIIQRATEIQGEVDRVRRGTSLQEARAKLQEEQASIAAKREQALDALAASFLLRKVEQEHSKTQPGVLERASELFGDFTRHAYSLTVVAGDGQGPPCFRAMENDTGRSKSLAELSGGTRIQLLLAVRLAFAEQAEGGAKLPLFLDETLKHSDPDRYDAIAACMHEITRGQRQVFYLTNDPVDVQRLKQSVPDPGVVHVIDLAECRRLGRGLTQIHIAVPPRRQVPPPDSRTPEEYGALLAVPLAQPLDGPDQIPLFWLLRGDLPLLHQLLCADVSTVGRWRSLRGRGCERLGLTKEDVARMDALCSVAEAFAESWCVGRCQPVTRDALIKAGVSELFIDRVWDLAQELGCDASKLMRVLRDRSDRRAKGFHAKAYAALDQSLRAEGFLCEDQALGEEGIRMQVLEAPGVDALEATEIMDCVHDLFVGAAIPALTVSSDAG